MSNDRTFVIVGAGQAGGRAAEALRTEGFEGRVVLVGDEPEPPYERPPLSKDFLLPTEEKPAIELHDADWYAGQSIDLLLERRVTGIDRAAGHVELADGERLGYDKLLLATGATPRRPDVPGADIDGLHYLRRVGDSRRLAADVKDGGRVVVVGAGWIGLETAAAARQWGCDVTVIEPQSTPLQAALGTEMGEYFAQVHRSRGVELLLGHGVVEFGDSGRLISVVTDQGDTIAADTVIVAIGAGPNTGLAEQSGLPVDNGVIVDASLRTGDPDVFVAGDAASAFHPRYDRHIRVEHWDNADNQPAVAAKAMLGRDAVYDRVPYFFTDQYDLGMEFTGWFPPGGYQRVVTRGDVDGNDFAAFWLDADSRVVAGMHINQWDDGIDPIAELVRSARPADADRLADPKQPLG